ncbi:MAG: DUF5723 family protein [Bacteroidales bacterium]|nr:DUF5723 family protein [Bacteroidales bacterium]
MKKELLKLAAILIIFSSTYNYAASQDMLGIVNSNYAGTNGILINPASMVNSKLCMDINVITLNPTLQNNYLYFNKEDYNISSLFNKSFSFNSQRNLKESTGEGVSISDNYDKKNKYFYNNVSMQLPSIMLAYNKHAFAISTSARTAFSVNNIAYHAAKFFFEGSDYKPQQGITYEFEDAQITQMSWSEISLSYAYLFSKNAASQWSAGISLKYLLGYDAVFARGYHNNYVFIDDETLQVNNMDAEYGYSIPVCPSSNEPIPGDKLFRGKGVGLNLGLIYQKNMEINRSNKKDFSSNRHEDYLYKIGLSLIDIGSIKFKHNAETYRLNNVNTYWEGFDTTNLTCVHDFNKIMSYKFYGDSLASESYDKFSIALPASISLQFDYQFSPGYYINTTIIQNLNIGNYQLSRPSLLSVTPRYESAWFEASLPVSMYNYQNTSVGLALRFYGVTIGTDNLGGFLGISDVYGFDFYCSVKISFVNGTCGKKRQSTKMSLLSFKKKNKRYKAKRSRSFAYAR